MFNKNPILCKFSNVGTPDIITSNDRVRASGINTEINENKMVEIYVVVDQAKGVSKD